MATVNKPQTGTKSFGEVHDKHKGKLSVFKSKAELIEERSLLCARSVTMKKGQYGWQWELRVGLLTEDGRYFTQNVFMGAEKDKAGKVLSEGYNNSMFRDQELAWPIHSLRLETLGARQVLKWYPDEPCSCSQVDPAEVETEDFLHSEEGPEQAPF